MASSEDDIRARLKRTRAAIAEKARNAAGTARKLPGAIREEINQRAKLRRAQQPRNVNLAQGRGVRGRSAPGAAPATPADSLAGRTARAPGELARGAGAVLRRTGRIASRTGIPALAFETGSVTGNLAAEGVDRATNSFGLGSSNILTPQGREEGTAALRRRGLDRQADIVQSEGESLREPFDLGRSLSQARGTAFTANAAQAFTGNQGGTRIERLQATQPVQGANQTDQPSVADADPDIESASQRLQAGETLNPLADLPRGTGLIRNNQTGAVTQIDSRGRQQAPRRLSRQSGGGVVQPTNPFNFAAPAIDAGSNALVRREQARNRPSGPSASDVRAQAALANAQTNRIQAGAGIQQQEFDQRQELNASLSDKDPQVRSQALQSVTQQVLSNSDNPQVREQGNIALASSLRRLASDRGILDSIGDLFFDREEPSVLGDQLNSLQVSPDGDIFGPGEGRNRFRLGNIDDLPPDAQALFNELFQGSDSRES